jgi:hypothetical protein
MRRLVLGVIFVLVGGIAASAQIVVYDPAVTARNGLTATIEQSLQEVQTLQRKLLRKMARRLSVLTDLSKYQLPDAPRWRIHVFGDPSAVLFAGDYNAALNYGDASGAAYQEVTVPMLDASAILGDANLSAEALREFASRLATIEVADATEISDTNDAGHVRYNGRKELAAINALEQDALDPSQDQSATAVLDKLSGATLVGTRQRQARAELLVGIVEQLLVDSKRDRDTDAASIAMQLTTWRDAPAANAAFVAGSGDALASWRQPY